MGGHRDMPPVDSPGAPASRPPPCPGGSALAPILLQHSRTTRRRRDARRSTFEPTETRRHIYIRPKRGQAKCRQRSVAEVSCVTLYRKTTARVINQGTHPSHPAPTSTRCSPSPRRGPSAAIISIRAPCPSSSISPMSLSRIPSMASGAAFRLLPPADRAPRAAYATFRV